jgi:hypothetical protein
MNVGKNSLKIPRGNQKANRKKTFNNNGQKKKDKGINKTPHKKTKDRATRIPLNTECKLRYSGRVSIFRSIYVKSVVLLLLQTRL